MNNPYTRTHGETIGGTTKEYRAWQAMLTRVRNPKAIEYSKYGGRGISVCERWLAFENFLTDMGRAPSPKHTVDRVDNDGNYEPGNCRWATYGEQRRNASHVVMVEIDGKRLCLKDACALRGVRYKLVHRRISALGWSVEEAMSCPKKTTWCRHKPHVAEVTT